MYVSLLRIYIPTEFSRTDFSKSEDYSATTQSDVLCSFKAHNIDTFWQVLPDLTQHVCIYSHKSMVLPRMVAEEV